MLFIELYFPRVSNKKTRYTWSNINKYCHHCVLHHITRFQMVYRPKRHHQCSCPVNSNITPTTFNLDRKSTSLSEISQGEVSDNREKWGDFWKKLMVVNRNIVLQPLWSYPVQKDIYSMSNIYFRLLWLMESFIHVNFYM
jgi:hypothetical protein